MILPTVLNLWKSPRLCIDVVEDRVGVCWLMRGTLSRCTLFLLRKCCNRTEKYDLSSVQFCHVNYKCFWSHWYFPCSSCWRLSCAIRGCCQVCTLFLLSMNG